MDNPCDCGRTHTSILAAIYCREQIETDDKEARRPQRPPHDNNIIRAYD